MSDTKNLVHIKVAPSETKRLREDLERAKEKGMFEGYEFFISGPDTDMIDVSALAEQLATELEDKE